MVLNIKNMVCPRCITAVEHVFAESGFKNFRVTLGTVEVEEIDTAKKDLLNQKLLPLGFELIDDRKSRIIESIKNLIIQKIHHQNLEEITVNWSDLITDKLPFDYKYLSRLFSSVEGITIEQFIIRQKIEKAKELLVYDEFTLSQISYKLGYSSIAHLSNQFKTVTGMTPRDFKSIGIENRKPLNEV
jgi:AraC-like DNA-binding protein